MKNKLIVMALHVIAGALIKNGWIHASTAYWIAGIAAAAVGYVAHNPAPPEAKQDATGILGNLKLILLLALPALLLSGCALVESPVPTTKITGQIGGQSFSVSNPKNTTISNLTVMVATNGTASLNIGSLTSVNDSNVIASSYTGQAAVVTATGQAINDGIKTAAGAAGQFVGAAAKTP